MKKSVELPVVHCPIQAAILTLASRLQVAATETVPIHMADGRVLSDDLLADRDSPACDVSAMDGYAIRIEDTAPDKLLPIRGECSAGRPAIQLQAGAAVRIFTGAPLPIGADTVVEREQAEVLGEHVRFTVGLGQLKKGRSVRKQGENIRKGQTALSAGTLLSDSAISSLSSFGPAQVQVRKRVRVSVLNTGSELVEPGQAVKDWQIRDSNGPLLESVLRSKPYVDWIGRDAVHDSVEAIHNKLSKALQQSDVVLLTGGVSVGDYDFVPQVLKDLGVERVFHRLPQKPGKPVFGGVGREGQLVCGLPGNPVSVAVTGRRIAIPLIKFIAGFSSSCLQGAAIQVKVQTALQADQQVLFQMATLLEDGTVAVDANKGSGDLVSLGRSDGFIEINPFVKSEDDRRRLYLWEL